MPTERKVILVAVVALIAGVAAGAALWLSSRESEAQTAQVFDGGVVRAMPIDEGIDLVSGKVGFEVVRPTAPDGWKVTNISAVLAPGAPSSMVELKRGGNPAPGDAIGVEQQGATRSGPDPRKTPVDIGVSGAQVTEMTSHGGNVIFEVHTDRATFVVTVAPAIARPPQDQLLKLLRSLVK